LSDTSPRKVAVYFLGSVLKQEETPDVLGQRPEFLNLSIPDRSLCRQLVLGTLRNLRFIDALLDHFCQKPLRVLNPFIRNVLRISVYQMVMLDKVPNYAAVNEAVQMVKRSFFRKQTGFVNAILRNIARMDNMDAVLNLDLQTADGLAVRYSHPTFLVQRWLDKYPYEKIVSWLNRSNNAPLHFLTVNTKRLTVDDFLDLCGKAGLECRRATFNPISVEVRGSLNEFIPMMEEGFCFPQDIWSCQITRLIPEGKYSRILDICAAPGGKSFSLALRFPFSRISALDRNVQRLRVMSGRARILSFNEIDLLAADARTPPLQQESFDLVLVDAPCSGSGTLQKNPDIRWKITFERVQRLSRLQREILHSASTLLRSSGILIYATCSAEKEENQEVVSEFMRKNRSQFRILPVKNLDPSLMTSDEYFQSFPNAKKGEGFFGAVLQKI